MPTSISWTEETWNPVTGCTPISEACRYCYAKASVPLQQAGRGREKYINGFNLTLHPEYLLEPRRWRTPKLIFVCSMSDLFHDGVPFDFIDRVMDVVKSSVHTFQFLTKRAERMGEYFASRPIPKNLWLGVTVENNLAKKRIDILRNLNAPIRFLSCEPLLEDLGEIDLTGIHWVIVGGEKGPANDISKARRMKQEWVLSLREQIEKQGALFHFKQWGSWCSDGVARHKDPDNNKLNGEIIQPIPPKYESEPTLFG